MALIFRLHLFVIGVFAHQLLQNYSFYKSILYLIDQLDMFKIAAFIRLKKYLSNK